MEEADTLNTDVEKKVERILKLIKRRQRAKKEPEIVGLVEDLLTQYQSLYAKYENLTQETGKETLDGEGDESCSSYASCSDSEYYSSEDIDINTNVAFDGNKSFQRRMLDNVEEESKRAYAKVADVNHLMASKIEETKALGSDYLAAVSKIQKMKTVNRDLRKEVDEKEKRLSALEKVHKGLEEQNKDNENSLMSKIVDSSAQISSLKKEVECLRARSYESFGKANVMDQESDSQHRQKSESEILLERKCQDISQYEYLIQVKILKDELARKNAMEQIMAEEKEGLQVKVMDLDSEVDSLRNQKNRLEDGERSNIIEINQLREEKGKLNARILDLKALLRERGLEFCSIQEDSGSKRNYETAHIVTLNGEVEREKVTNKYIESNSKLVRRFSTGTLNLHILERKVEDLSGKFHKKAEDNICLLRQRITVAEKMHFENKDTCKKMREKLELENGALGEKLAVCEAECRKLKDSMEPGKNAMNGPNSVENKLAEEDEFFMNCISNVKEDIASANYCSTGKEKDIEQPRSNVHLAVAEIGKENEEVMLREKVSTLETKLIKEGEQKLKLLKAMTKLENKVGELQKVTKEKDQILLCREEEKREAIRQLCLLIDYQRSRCVYLKDLISKLAVRSKKKT